MWLPVPDGRLPVPDGRSLPNAIQRPSGDQVGATSFTPLWVRRTWCEPSADINQISLVFCGSLLLS
jgi:hypothetical protein